MHTKKFTLSTLLFLAVAAACFAGSRAASADETKATPADDAATILIEETQVIEPATSSADETQAVAQANAQFYASLNALFGGDVAPMQQIWSHADDVTYMGPVGGIQTGWQQVGTAWEVEAGMKLGGKVDPVATQITVGGNLASVQCLEVGNNLDADGKPEEVSIRSTSLFRKENGQWKMIGHHTDLLPFFDTGSEETSDIASDEKSDTAPDNASDVKPQTNSDE
jgi:ketosteroid isomerase-like protein